MAERSTCRSCGHDDLVTFLSLGTTPLADALVDESRADEPEARFPLDMAFCPVCSLVQITEDVPPEVLFVANYLYFSSFSDMLLQHSRDHALTLIQRQGLGPGSLVVEVASNDGYLLKNFVDAGIDVLGIDPAPDQAEAARAAGVPTLEEFFGVDLARRLLAEGRGADVIIANNVMAHVPDLNGFVSGIAELLTEDGVATIENPYVRDLIDHCEFDTVYHEHHCYFSCTAIDTLVRRNGLYLNDVEYFPSLHGGTLRWYLGRREDVSPTVTRYLEEERESGLTSSAYYTDFARRVETLRDDLRTMLGDLRAQGKTVAGYGAAAKGATMLNYCDLDRSFVDFVVDRNVHKQGKLMPGTGQPILDTSALIERRPDYVLLLAWNFADEIVAQQADYLRSGGRFITPVPTPTIMAEHP